ncbi:MAG: hypothetical protein RML46_00300 [Anaerolineae bacterium]|nr:hypothetical protein [Anaerolineae bacterium]MDW8067334.1 hypothetical protein [Anaerolineae bacterium]
MSQDRITLLLMVGGWAGSPVESALRRAHQAAAGDLLETLGQTGRVEQAVIATDDPSWVPDLPGLPLEVDVDRPDEPFHFGRRLAGLIERIGADRVLYAGGGSAPLMTSRDWQDALSDFLGDRPQAVTNNRYSSDWIAFYPARALASRVATLERDNALGWALSEEWDIPTRALDPSAATRLDLDTPADLLIARLHPRVGPRLRAALNALDWPTGPVERVLEVMGRDGGHLAIIGRTAPAAWMALDQATRCWVRLFVEERGMVASGRLRRGEVRSLLAHFLEQVGVDGFFAELSSLAEAALMDTRVLMAARGCWPSPADRFNADLLRWQEVEDPFLRAFTHAAARASIPLLLGGQSLVNGGLMALVEILETRRQPSL